jgi:TonB family protein
MTKWPIFAIGSIITFSALVSVGTWNGVSAQEARAETDPNLRLIDFEDIAYPIAPRMGRIQGVVVFEVAVDQAGKVASVTRLSGPAPLAEPTAETIKKWKFSATRPTKGLIVLDFRIDNSGVCKDTLRSLFLLRSWRFASITTCESRLEG